MFENLNFGKTFHLILMHFIPNIHCFEEFFKNRFIFSKILFFQNFNWSSLFFYQSKLIFDQSKLIFKQSKIVCQVLKNHIWLVQITFSNSFISLRFGQAQSSLFCRFQPNVLHSFPLPRPVCPLYPFFFIYFQFFMHFFMHWRVIFELSIFWGFWWFKPCFVKLIIGFLF